jgi:hypothetical protein
MAEANGMRTNGTADGQNLPPAVDHAALGEQLGIGGLQAEAQKQAMLNPENSALDNTMNALITDRAMYRMQAMHYRDEWQKEKLRAEAADNARTELQKKLNEALAQRGGAALEGKAKVA